MAVEIPRSRLVSERVSLPPFSMPCGATIPDGSDGSRRRLGIDKNPSEYQGSKGVWVPETALCGSCAAGSAAPERGQTEMVPPRLRLPLPRSKPQARRRAPGLKERQHLGYFPLP